LRSRSGASRRRRRVRAGRAVARGPDHPFAAGPASLARLVAALEVGRAWVALGGSVVPHRAAADRAQRHAGRVHSLAAGAGRCRARHSRRGRRTCAAHGSTGRSALRGRRGRRRACRRRRRSRRPDHAIATAVLALEVRRLGIALPLAIVPHRAPTSRAAGDVGGRLGRYGLGHAARRVKGLFQSSREALSRPVRNRYIFIPEQTPKLSLDSCRGIEQARRRTIRIPDARRQQDG
jgi:hypothetical protein